MERGQNGAYALYLQADEDAAKLEKEVNDLDAKAANQGSQSPEQLKQQNEKEKAEVTEKINKLDSDLRTLNIELGATDLEEEVENMTKDQYTYCPHYFHP